MISLKRYLSSFDRTDRASILQRALSLILEGATVHAVDCDPEETAVFQNTIRRLGTQLTRDNLPPAEVLVITGSIIQALDQHERHTSRVVSSERRELQSMVAALASVIARVCRHNERACTSLGEIEKQVTKATQLEDLHLVKAKLEACLSNLRTELELQSEETRNAREALHAAAATPVAAAAMEQTGDDAITGLPLRKAALELLAETLNQKGTAYAVPVFLDNLQVVRARFGHETADKMILLVAQTMGQKLAGEDRLFRWSAGSLLALIRRDAPADAVRGEFNRLAASRIEHVLKIDQRTVMLPVQFSFACFPVWQAPDVDSLAGSIDSFVLKRATGGS